MVEHKAQKKRAGKLSSMRLAKVVGVALILGGAVFSALRYGHGICEYVCDVVKVSKRLPSQIAITNCSLPVRESLSSGIDSIVRSESLFLNRSEIARVARAIPEVEKVSVKRLRGESNGWVTQIAVTERKPVAMIHSGKIFLVDKKGVRFSSCPGAFYDLPLLVYSGASLGDTVDLGILNTIKKTSRGIGGDFFHDISQICINSASDVNLIFGASVAEYTVFARDIENRLIHVKELRERFFEENAEPARVDLRYRGLAFATAQ
jgi:hypothetical protein